MLCLTLIIYISLLVLKVFKFTAFENELIKDLKNKSTRRKFETVTFGEDVVKSGYDGTILLMSVL